MALGGIHCKKRQMFLNIEIKIILQRTKKYTIASSYFPKIAKIVIYILTNQKHNIFSRFNKAFITTIQFLEIFQVVLIFYYLVFDTRKYSFLGYYQFLSKYFHVKEKKDNLFFRW